MSFQNEDKANNLECHRISELKQFLLDTYLFIGLNFERFSPGNIDVMTIEDEKIVIHLELSKNAAALLYTLNQHALKRPSLPDPEDHIDNSDQPDNFETEGVAVALRKAFIGKNTDCAVLSFTEADFDELTREIGVTVWDALH